MADGVWDEPDDGEPLSDRRRSASDLERERLRAVLDFPESVETGGSFERHGGRRGPVEPPAPGPAANIEEPTTSDDEVGRRLHQLTLRVEAVAGLVETLFDRLESSVGGSSASLTAEQLADVSARMVRLIEMRLETHSERLEQVIVALATREPPPGAADEDAGGALGLIDDHMAMIGRAITDVKESIKELEQPPSEMQEMQEMAILAHLDRWFEETNSRQAAGVEHVRRDMHGFDQALIDVKATMAELPDRQALRELYRALSQLSQHEGLGDLQEAINELPDRVAMQQPIARLDASILQQLDVKLAETSESLAQKVDDQLASRVQRFEALSQAMMTLVGDPVDALADKLSQVVRAQEAAPNVLQSIGELTQIQSQLAAAISSLRQDGVEREVLLRQALEKLDRLTEPE